jgi:hypothetical protein
VKEHVLFDKGVTKWWKGVVKQMSYKTLQNKWHARQILYETKHKQNITKDFLNKNKTTHYKMQNKTKMSPNLLKKML